MRSRGFPAWSAMLLLAAMTAQATIIDDFSVSSGPPVSATTGSGPCAGDPPLLVGPADCAGSTTQSNIGAFLAERTFWSAWTAGNGFVSGDINFGRFSSNRGSEVFGDHEVFYSLSAPTDIDFLGGFSIDVVAAEVGGFIQFFVFDGTNLSISSAISIPTTPGRLYAPWSDFTGSANRNAATGLGFLVTDQGLTDAVDVSLNNFQGIPEPATYALIGLGLAAFSFAARRKFQ